MNGEDAHFSYGKEQIYPGDNFDYHLIPFEAAFAAGTAQIMPYYGMPVGTPHEEVGFGFNKSVITGLLREKYGFDGVVCTDWQLLADKEFFGRTMTARAWGVEHLTPLERAKKALDAGVDQFGGEASPELIVELVRGGQVPEARIDESARRILRDKFRLGLFDNPYLDAAAAERIAGQAAFAEAGALAQRKAIVLLKNGAAPATKLLPLPGRPKIYVEGIAPEVAGQYGQVVADPAAADLAILRLSAPYDPRDNEPLESFFHAGDLRFKPDELARIQQIMAQVPTIVDIYLDRPAVIPEIAAGAAALLANFGASDDAVLDVIFGRFRPAGKLPFELPSSIEAVLAQHPDVPYDSEHPLFPFGFGLTF
jgi:beta-glucosidase